MRKTALNDNFYVMRGNLKFREVRTASGSTAIQIIRYDSSKRIIVKHVGSAKTEDELIVLRQEAEQIREQLSQQLSFFPLIEKTNLLHEEHLQLHSVTHLFAYRMLRQCSKLCFLGDMNSLYQDLALMRIIEPASKPQSQGKFHNQRPTFFHTNKKFTSPFLIV